MRRCCRPDLDAPQGAVWQAIGIGRAQPLPCLFAALALGGNLRVGFEDNVYFRKGELAQSNAQFVSTGGRAGTGRGARGRDARLRPRSDWE